MGTHAPGLNALLFLALGAKGPPPACSAQKEGGIPASVSGGPNPGMCVFRGGRWPGCLLLWEAGVNWDVERANPV